MKKKLFYIPLLALLLIGCSRNSNNSSTENISDFTTEDDPVKEIIDGGTVNKYDANPFMEDAVEIPTEYKGSNLETISEAGIPEEKLTSLGASFLDLLNALKEPDRDE